MCGIAGVVSLDGRPVDPREVGSMCSVMVHRGPDDEGHYVGRGAALGMRRLSIIDPARGRQPLCNEAGTIWAVCNGEIYNFKELRDELERRGHSFVSGSDSETIVHLYEEHGRRCVERMRGMFAMALWDEGRRELLLARDRVGIKPLYYAVAGGRLVFDSCDVAYLYGGKPPTGSPYYGEVCYRYEYRRIHGDWFFWLFIDRRTLTRIAGEEGWMVKPLFADRSNQYLVECTLI